MEGKTPSTTPPPLQHQKLVDATNMYWQKTWLAELKDLKPYGWSLSSFHNKSSKLL